MFTFFKKKPVKEDSPPAATGPDQRLYAVGDIHGRADLLALLLAQIEEDAALHPQKDKKVIFLGDYVDRGLDSKGVIDRFLRPFPNGLVPFFLRGNHDDLFLSFLQGDIASAPMWLDLGGLATLASYGVNTFSPGNEEKLRRLHQEAIQKVPAHHLAFFKNTLFSVSFGDYFFVHAGVRPGIPLNRQTPEDFLWIRGDFLFSEDPLGAVVVHGHTIKKEPEVKENRIGLDTGAFATGRLTCLVLDGADRSFLST